MAKNSLNMLPKQYTLLKIHKIKFVLTVLISFKCPLLDDLKDRRGYSHLKKEALDRTMWRNRFRGGFGPVVRQNTE